MIRVLLADDQALVRAGFRALLDAQGDIEAAASPTPFRGPIRPWYGAARSRCPEG